MKNFKVVFPIVCLLGMIISLIGLFKFSNNDQIMFLVILFITFGFSGLVILLIEKGIAD